MKIRIHGLLLAGLWPLVEARSSGRATCSNTYRVVSGDTCWAIYTKYGIAPADFYNLNPSLSASNCPLSIGQTVCVGSSSYQSTLIASITPAASVGTCSVTYKVMSGDTCWSIYTQYNMASTDFYSLNPSLSASNCPLSIGQTVCVGASSSKPSSVASGPCALSIQVSSGDTCQGLINQYNPALTLQQLIALNPTVNSGCTNLAIGQVLCMRSSPVTWTSTSTSTLYSTSTKVTSSSKITSITSPTKSLSNPTSTTSISTHFTTTPSSVKISSKIVSTSITSSVTTTLSLVKISSTTVATSVITSATPVPTSLQGLNFNNSLPFVCNTTYVIQPNDTCATVASNFSLSVSQLQTMNPALSCSELQNSTSVCTRDGRDGCLSFTSVTASDTCESLAARAQIGVQALLSYNPDLDCTFLVHSIGIPLCISAMVTPCSTSSRATYTIQTNDTCDSIALSRNISVASIISLNPLADCTTTGLGADTLCLSKDLSSTPSEQVNYQLLGLLVNAFHFMDSSLIPEYMTYLTNPSNSSVTAVMDTLFPLFLTTDGQQQLNGLEASNPFIGNLEVSYAGKTRADYCSMTSMAPDGIVNQCFCGNTYPFLSCIAQMYSIWNDPADFQKRDTMRTKNVNFGSVHSRKPKSKRDCEFSKVFDFRTESDDGSLSDSDGEACYEASCCVDIEGTPLCLSIAVDGCISGGMNEYHALLASNESPQSASYQFEIDSMMESHLSIGLAVCVIGLDESSPAIKALKKIGIDIEICDHFFEADWYNYRGDFDFIAQIGVIFGLEFGGILHADKYIDIGECKEECTTDKPYCYVDVGKSWWSGMSLFIDLFFWKINIPLIKANTPDCPPGGNPPGAGVAPPKPVPGKQLSAYYGNWNIWTVGGGVFSPIPTSEISKLDSINYAFATVSYYFDPASSATDSYGFYVDFTDWFGDIAKDLSSSGGACRAVDTSSLCHDNTGRQWLAMAPYIGAYAGQLCPTYHCTNSQGPTAGGRSTPCQTLIDLTQLPQINGAVSFCGQMIYVLDNLRSINKNMKALISIGGWYDSAYFAWAVVPAADDDFAGNFKRSIVAFVDYFGWDGVDIDWEYPEFLHGGQTPPPVPKGKGKEPALTDTELSWINDPAHSPDDVNSCSFTTFDYFGSFLGALRAALPSAQISVAAASGSDKIFRGSENLARTLCSIDGVIINLMTYDMHGAFDNPKITAHQAPIYPMPWYTGSGSGYTVSSAVSTYLTNCPTNSVRVGLPFYGRAYTNVHPGTTCGLGQSFDAGPVDSSGDALLPSYNSIVSGGYSIYHDSSNWNAAYGLRSDGMFVSFEDEVSVSSKLNYTMGVGLAGAFYWLTGNDRNGELVNVIWQALQNGESPIVNGSTCPGVIA